VTRLWRLDERIARSDDDGFSGSDPPRLASRIVAAMPLDLAHENCVGQLSLDDDANLGAWMVVHWKYCTRHHRDPAKRKFGVFDGDRRSAAENFACVSNRCGGFRCSVLGERKGRVASPHKSHGAQDYRDD
jgi:hypothetical protein